MNHLAFGAALAVLIACGPAAAARADVTRAQLANGLTLLIEERTSAPSVGVAVAYGVGKRDDPPELAGLAHLTEHAMANCQGHLQEGAHARLERLGVSPTAFTTVDATVFQSTLPGELLETVLWIEAQRMAFTLALLDEAAFERTKAVVTREWERRELQRDAIETLMLRALYPESHPYHNLVETEDSLSTIELDAVQGAFQRNYGPDNAVLAVVGNVDRARVRDAVQRYFGEIRASANARVAWRTPAAAALPLRRTQTRTDYPGLQDLRFETLLVSWPTPALGEDGDADLDILSSMLAERLRERFMREGSVFSTEVRQQSRALASHFSVTLRVEPGHARSDVLQVLDSELRALTSPSADFVRAQRRFVQAEVVECEDLGVRAGRLAESVSLGKPPLEAARYRASSAQSVARSAAQYLAGKPHLIIERPMSRFQSTPVGVRQ